MTALSMPFAVLLAVLGAIAAGLMVLYHVLRGLSWVLARVFRGVGWVLGRCLRFARDEGIGILHTVGAILTGAAITPLALGNLAIGRWQAAKYYGGALRDEALSGMLGAYRLAIGRPLRFLGLGTLVAGLERRLPDVVQRAPRQAFPRAVPRGLAGERTFPGYDVVGELPAGGSGARLFLARPRPETLARFRDSGRAMPDDVVIKSFAVAAGSTLPQIVREGRALEAARDLGLVLQHALEEGRFWYVMPYVRGRELGDVVTDMHARSGPGGLDDDALARVNGYTRDVLAALERFHDRGLWHKDVKPSNVIVSDGRAHLVDLGLVTPLGSAMTLTTHGTEYYRDPELVRQALRGARVNEVDGVKFDLYAAGAVLYSMLENSFPAHGSLSRITKRCPDALAWIVRRAMAEPADRYASAREMGADLAVLAERRDPFAVLPAELPSFAGAMAGPDRRDDASARRATPPLPPRAEATASARPDRPHAFDDAVASRNASRRAERDERRAERRHHGLVTVAVLCLGGVAFIRILPAVAHQHGGDSIAIAAANARERATLVGDRLHRVASKLDSAAQRVEERFGAFQAPEGPQRPEQPAVAPRPAAETRWSSRLTPLLESLPSGPADAGADGSRGCVLVIDDLVGEAAARSVASLREALGGAGLSVVGAGSVGSDPTAAVELEAAARKALGLADASEPEGVARLQDFLDGRDDLAAVIWLAPGGKDGDPVYRLLLARDHRPAGAGTIGELAKASSRSN